MGDVTDCVAKCDQGDGSTEASNKYGKCRDACISSFIITSGTAAPGGVYTTAGQSVVSGAASSGAAASGTGKAAASGTSSGSSAASTSKAASAAGLQTTVSGGLIGLVLGAFALL